MLAVKVISLLLLSAHTFAITPITQQGTGFVAGSEQFFFVGVDYQPGGSTPVNQGFDPLSNLEQCQRDVYLMQQLGINSIRTYSVNITLNHDECMSLLAAAGIYVVLDVNSSGWEYSVNSAEPWTSYNWLYMSNVLGVMEQFRGYRNVLGFFSGNEVANDPADAQLVARYLRAIQRDMRMYIQQHSPRTIPIGYSATDNIPIRQELAEYLACSGPDNGYSDFYGLNSYEWCGTNTFQGSGYATLVELFSNLSIPVFLSEFGCNQVQPREFGDVSVLYTDQMNSVFSGGLVYEFDEASNNFGLVSINNNGDATILQDFDTLHRVYANVSLPTKSTYSNRARPACSAIAPGITAFDATQTIPTQAPGIADLIASGVSGVARGKIIDVDLNLQSVTWKITDAAGNVIANPTISTVSGWNIPISSVAVTSEGAVTTAPPLSSTVGVTAATTTSTTGGSTTAGTRTSSSASTTTSATKSAAIRNDSLSRTSLFLLLGLSFIFVL